MTGEHWLVVVRWHKGLCRLLSVHGCSFLSLAESKSFTRAPSQSGLTHNTMVQWPAFQQILPYGQIALWRMACLRPLTCRLRTIQRLANLSMTISTELTTLQRLFDELFIELDDILADLPPEALLWKPFETSPWKGPCNPLGWIVAHTVSSTVYLLRRAEWTLERIDWKAVDGDEGRNEFGPANHDPAYLRERVARVQAFTHATLGSLTADELECSRPHARRAELVFNVRSDIIHALEHMAQHIGHAQITRQLWALQN